MLKVSIFCTATGIAYHSKLTRSGIILKVLFSGGVVTIWSTCWGRVFGDEWSHCLATFFLWVENCWCYGVQYYLSQFLPFQCQSWYWTVKIWGNVHQGGKNPPLWNQMARIWSGPPIPLFTHRQQGPRTVRLSTLKSKSFEPPLTIECGVWIMNHSWYAVDEILYWLGNQIL